MKLTAGMVKGLKPEVVSRMSEGDAYAVFVKLRWPETGGSPVCPRCENAGVYRCSPLGRFRCMRCDYQFTPFTKTMFSSAKMPYRKYVHVIALVADGENAMSVSETVGIQYKSAWRLVERVKAAMAVPEMGKPARPVLRSRVNYFFDCANCGTRFLDENGERASELRRGKKDKKHAYCSHACYGQHRAKSRAEQRCRRCLLSRKELSPWRSERTGGVTGVTFSNGYCQPCYRLLAAYHGDEGLCKAHEVTQLLRKETANVNKRQKYRRPSENATGNH